MGGGESRARGCQAGQGEERERLGGEARQLGTGKSELEPGAQHVCASTSHPLTPLTRWLAVPLPVQAKHEKSHYTPIASRQSRSLWNRLWIRYRRTSALGREEVRVPSGCWAGGSL